MRSGALVLFVSLLLAGCVGDGPEPAPVQDFDPAAPHDDQAPTQGSGASQDVGDSAAALPYPRLVDLDGESLREGVAVLDVPAGQYRLVRLVFTPDVWGEDEPWDGSASIQVGYRFEAEGNGTIMSAFGFASPFDDSEPIRPYIDFFPVEGSGMGFLSLSSSCSGGCETVPRHEAAWLFGADGAPATFHIGIVSGMDDLETLEDRETVPVRADAQTEQALAGYSVRSLFLLAEQQFVAGAMDSRWGGTWAPTGTALERTSHHEAAFDAQERGTLVAGLAGQDAAGLEEWSYSLESSGVSGDWDGAWVHAPQATTLAATGAVWPPVASAQGVIDAGPVAFAADRSFTGQGEPVGLVAPSYEYAHIGFAGIDLEATLGWDVSRPPIPDQQAGMAMCRSAPVGPGLVACFGDPDHPPAVLS